jgi:DNA-binding beta-propeller fold protein YncE
MTPAVLWPAVVVLLSTAAAPPPKHSAAPILRLRRTIPLPGAEGWDGLTIDPVAQRLYVTRSTKVVVVDLKSEVVVGEVGDTPGVRAIALAPDLGRGFTSNGGADDVTIFDMEKLSVLGRVSVGKGPEAIVYDPFSRSVFAFNGETGDVTAIDAAQSKALGSVALGGKPGAAVSDGKGRLFVNVADKNEIVALDSSALAVTSRWPLAACEAPTGLALDRTRRRLFVGCRNRVMTVVDADSGKVIATLAIGRGPGAVAVDEARGLAFASTDDGTLTVVKEEKSGGLAVVENTLTRPGSGTLALDPRAHRIYVAACSFGPRPDATKEAPHPPAPIIPGTFTILVYAR